MTIPHVVLPRDNLVYPVKRLQLYYEVIFGRETNALVAAAAAEKSEQAAKVAQGQPVPKPAARRKRPVSA